MDTTGTGPDPDGTTDAPDARPVDPTLDAGPAVDPAAAVAAPVAAWYPDPARRHQFRYWNGSAWTGDVATNGITSWDPPYTDHPGATAAHAPVATVAPGGAPPAVVVDRSALRRTSGLATALGWILGIAAGALVARLAAAVFQIVQVRTAQTWDESKDPAPIIRRLQDSDNFLDATAAIAAAFLVVILVVLIVWMYRSARNARAIDRWDNGLTPGWAIGGWFVPIANWFVPATIMQSLWRGAEPLTPEPGAPKRRSAAVGLWWVCYLAGMLAFAQGLGVDTVNADSAQQVYNANTWTIVGCVLLAVAAIVLRGNLLAIQRRNLALTSDAV